MPFVFFADHYPELADRETRSILVLEEPGDLPVGDYAFLEMFCDEAGCDCRRVMLQVFTPRERPEAVIAFGWEKPAFYARWLRDDDPAMIAELQGPVLNLGSPGTELAPAILELARNLLLRDRRYVERLKRHYALMRAKVDRQAAGPAPAGTRKRVGRNDPCPCGSGRKFKKCCAGKELGAAAGEEGELELALPNAVAPAAAWVDEIAIGREVDHIIESAADGVARVVHLGSLVLFSTSGGDAWILDHGDGCALPLADDGVRLPGRIVESEQTFQIEWTHDFHEVDDGVMFIDRSTEETAILTGALAREVLRT